MNFYCKSCKFHIAMKYDPQCRNFICLSCDKLLIGRHGYEIFEFNDAGNEELYVTKEMFLYLIQKGFLKSLMDIYKDKIWISLDK